MEEEEEEEDESEEEEEQCMKVRAADLNTSNTSGKATVQVFNHSAHKEHSKGRKLCEHQQRKNGYKDSGAGSICNQHLQSPLNKEHVQRL